MSKLYNIAKKAFFEPIKKNLNPGKAIKSVKTNVPDTTLKKLDSRLKILEQKRIAANKMLDQTYYPQRFKVLKKLLQVEKNPILAQL